MSSESKRRRSDIPFLSGLGAITFMYLLLIVGMLAANMRYTSFGDLSEAIANPDIQFSIRLTLITCTITAILSVFVAVPTGYLLSRYRFPGKQLVDAILDIPIVLPPLVIGLSLLILFNNFPLVVTPIGHVLALASGLGIFWIIQHNARSKTRNIPLLLICLLVFYIPVILTYVCEAKGIESIEILCQRVFGKLLAITGIKNVNPMLEPGVTYKVAAVIIAQFTVSCAFAVRTMRHTFEQISPRTEQVALTLGCTRSQAFWSVVLPEAGRGILTAGTLAWARAMGEFGPILVFAAATRGRTEVLSTSVFLEITVGNLEGAVAVSMIMVTVAIIVLVTVRFWDKGSEQVL